MFSEIKILLVVLGICSILVSGTFGYKGIKQQGYLEAKSEYDAKFNEYVKLNQSKVDKIISTSNVILSEQRKNTIKAQKGVNSILNSTKGKVLVIEKEGKCVPTQDFLDSIPQINKQINLDLQGKLQ